MPVIKYNHFEHMHLSLKLNAFTGGQQVQMQQQIRPCTARKQHTGLCYIDKGKYVIAIKGQHVHFLL